MTNRLPTQVRHVGLADPALATSSTILIRGATVLSMDPAIGDLAEGDVLIHGDTIADAADHLDPPAGAAVVDATGHIVIPGFVDTHRHMFQAVVRGIAPHHRLENYYTDVLGKIGTQLTPHDVYLGDLLSARGALDAGVTTVQDISNIQDTPEHTDAAIAALKESGIRAVFAFGNSFPRMLANGALLPDDIRRVRKDVLNSSEDLVTMAAVTEWGGDEDVEHGNHALTRELDLPVARHISAGMPVARFHELGLIQPGTVFIHGNGLSAEELEIIANSGSSLSVSPVIEQVMGFGDPVLAFAPPSLPLSLSIDVEVTVAGDFLSHLRAAYQVARAQQFGQAETRREFTVSDILRMATIDGAQALGLGHRTGSVTPGKQADLVLLRTDRLGVGPVNDPYSAVVLHADRSDIDTVMVAGRVVKQAGRMVTDSAPLLAEAEQTARRLERTGALPLCRHDR